MLALSAHNITIYFGTSPKYISEFYCFVLFSY